MSPVGTLQPHPGWEAAKRVADAVLYEGYLLYPYRASSSKNQVRWQFGVLAPRAWTEDGGSESWTSRTECLVVVGAGARLDVRVRFLHLQARQVEAAEPGASPAGEGGGPGAGPALFRPVESLDVDGRAVTTWDEGVEVELDRLGLDLDALLGGDGTAVPLEVAAGSAEEPLVDREGRLVGRIVRERWALAGRLRISADPTGTEVGGLPLARLRLDVENLTPWTSAGGGERDEALRRSMVGAHLLVGVSGGRFLSLTDPPPSAAAAAASCQNLRTWPVLAGPEGDDDVVLSSPIILGDHPEVAPESQSELCDATEIDEILTLRIMTMTDEEKAEARSTDERARQIVDQADTLSPELLARLHGAIRSLRPVGARAGAAGADPVGPTMSGAVGPPGDGGASVGPPRPDTSPTPDDGRARPGGAGVDPRLDPWA
ncbi:MAG: hypothetical protein ACRD0J_15790, partial [Acidimicrobiales bacterium]